MIVKIKKHKSTFVIIDKEPLQNPNLSWRAKGLLAYLLCLPDDWIVMLSELQQRSKDGRKSLGAAFRELKEHGHAVLVTVRNSKGQLAGKEWHILESPLDKKQHTMYPPKMPLNTLERELAFRNRYR